MSYWSDHTALDSYTPHGYANFEGYHGYTGDELDMNQYDSGCTINYIDPSLRDLDLPSDQYLVNRGPVDRWYPEAQPVFIFPCLDPKSSHLQFKEPDIIGALPYPYRESVRSSCGSIQDAPSPATVIGSPENSQYGPASDSPILTSQVTLRFGNYSSQILPACANINPKDVQSFADEQDGPYFDEGFVDMSMQEINAEIEMPIVKQEPHQAMHYNQKRDEGLGGSIHSEAASPASNTVKTDDLDTDIDAEGEDVDDEPIEMDVPIHEDEDEDGTYSPGSGRKSTRRNTKSVPHRPAKKNTKNKVSKSTNSRKSKLTCKTCQHVAKDSHMLVKHIAVAHTRPYTCAFAFAGCSSTFGNKNEWKRHVTSQHLSLQYWRCDVEQCAATKPKSRGALASNEFNRKDLFTQHLRRMHAPLPVKQHGTTPEWEAQVKHLQTQCLKKRRDPPQDCRCPIPSCAQPFHGATSWDERMEHVGQHLERKSSAATAAATINANIDTEIVQESDEYMLEWCLEEKIIERKPGGGYRLCLKGGGVSSAHEESEDAEGEEE
jgi:hypothetical protein